MPEFERMMWENVMAHNDSRLIELLDGEPRLVFRHSRFRRLFYRIWIQSARWRWGLIELGYFDTMRIVTLDQHRCRFAPRLDNVQYSDFEAHEEELLFHELHELPLDSTSESEEV